MMVIYVIYLQRTCRVGKEVLGDSSCHSRIDSIKVSKIRFKLDSSGNVDCIKEVFRSKFLLSLRVDFLKLYHEYFTTVRTDNKSI